MVAMRLGGSAAVDVPEDLVPRYEAVGWVAEKPDKPSKAEPSPSRAAKPKKKK